MADEDRETPKGANDRLIGENLPPASFFTVVTTLQGLALQFLGELDDSSSEETEIFPSLAKHYIDCLSILDEKTRGNLADEEKKFLDHVLTQLRLVYVKVSSGAEREEP